MPRSIGTLPLPDKSPHFLNLRLAVRPFVKKQPHVDIGLSGGPDSLALVAATLAEGAAVTAICIDHDLQENSGKIAEKAVETARDMGAQAIVTTVEVPAGEGMEAAAREARYAEIATHTSTIWVAHTMDDQAETYLLGALRGNPTGMLNCTQGEKLRIVRPFLTIRRADTVGACQELGLHPWIDPHNFDEAYKRVGIRTRVIPLLAEIHGGDPTPALALAATRAVEESAALETIVEKQKNKWSEGFPVTLVAQPKALRRKLLVAYLRDHGITVSSKMLEGIDRLLTDWHGQGAVAVGRIGDNRLEVARKDGTLTVIEKKIRKKLG